MLKLRRPILIRKHVPQMDEPVSSKPSLLERLSTMLLREPEDREQLVELLHSAYERNLLRMPMRCP